MSKAKNLGAGASFAQARPISARRAAIGAATGVPTAGVPDPTELALNLISQNPDNPREELRDLQGLAESIAEIGLVNAVTVASIEAYLAERPHRAADLDEGTRYIVVDGHRRLAAARLAGAATIRVSVDNALVSTDQALLEAAFVANVHRDDMNPLEQAQALRTLVDFYGSQTKAAKRLGIAQSTISSKLSVLDLDPQLQADLVEGRRKIEHVRNLSKLPPDEQRQQADARAAAGDQRRSAVRELSRRDSPAGEGVAEIEAGADASDGPDAPGSSGEQRTGASRRDNPGERQAGLSRRDNSEEQQAELSRRDNSGERQAGLSRRDSPGEGQAELSRRDSPGAPESVSPTHEEVPGQRSEHAERQVAPTQLAPGESGIVALGKVTKMPWHDGHQVADLVLRKMDEAQRKILVDRILAEDTNSVR
ncbi:ParB/RepB/Spo0J family partition protein (plasmid) [Streptomyces sp. NBC_01591]|uniref:ParB/RepB/Spo0J family partition protein n=1 Tax=Streptomyces sp. NBC_01591 TaxID=2975888 RepID=UPI002DD92B1C|nr:ParB/RepB/Spo0J family partition protein [Streptomyces sp. NBC_01591]WSD73850.1 ParB/RepB/Spo0J family partition protein [Streptomyces sp. NBC_01591]